MEIVLKVLLVVRSVQTEVSDAMPLTGEFLGKAAHGSEKPGHLLDVVSYIVRFLSHLHHGIDHVIPDFLKPAVVRVELIPQNQTKRFFSCHGRFSSIGLVFLIE
jgi:hypothetical protein